MRGLVENIPNQSSYSQMYYPLILCLWSEPEGIITDVFKRLQTATLVLLKLDYFILLILKHKPFQNISSSFDPASAGLLV